jgi:hypothetical protein
MNTFSTFTPTTLKPEPGKRVMSAKDLRKQLLDISAVIADTKVCRDRAMRWDASPTKLWTIQCYDNRVADLMDQATVTARLLASAPVEIAVEHPDV